MFVNRKSSLLFEKPLIKSSVHYCFYLFFSLYFNTNKWALSQIDKTLHHEYCNSATDEALIWKNEHNPGPILKIVKPQTAAMSYDYNFVILINGVNLFLNTAINKIYLTDYFWFILMFSSSTFCFDFDNTCKIKIE